MNRKLFWLITAILLVSLPRAGAQQQNHLRRVGMLVSGSESINKSRIEAFRSGLRDLGYVEGKTITIEYRFAEGRSDRFASLANDIVRSNPDVIVVGSNTFTVAAKEATRTIPIVSNGGDLVGQGIITNLAHPGGNVTGITNISNDLAGKRLQLLYEAIGKTLYVGILWHSGPDIDDLKKIESVAHELNVKIKPFELGDPKDFHKVFATIKREQANAVTILQNSFSLFHRKELLELTTANHLASMCEQAQWMEDGCLISYGPAPLTCIADLLLT